MAHLRALTPRSLAVQIGHSEPRWTIPLVLVANSLSLLLYNVAGMFVTEELGAVSRTVFESARTLFVWLGDLLLYYTHTGLGEKWDNSSYLQVRHRADSLGLLQKPASAVT